MTKRVKIRVAFRAVAICDAITFGVHLQMGCARNAIGEYQRHWRNRLRPISLERLDDLRHEAPRFPKGTETSIWSYTIKGFITIL